MHTYRLKGLSEGIVGQSMIKSEPFESIFEQFPALKAVRSKLVVDGKTITGLVPCDG